MICPVLSNVMDPLDISVKLLDSKNTKDCYYEKAMNFRKDLRVNNQKHVLFVLETHGDSPLDVKNVGEGRWG